VSNTATAPAAKPTTASAAPASQPTIVTAAQPTAGAKPGGAVAQPTPTSAQAALTADQKAAAVKEGEVNYYTATDPAAIATLKAEAEKALGIKVNMVRLSSGQIFNRVLQEFDQGVNAADVLETSLIEQFADMKTKGMLAPFVPSNVALYRGTEYYDAEHYWNATRVSMPAINYNTDLVKGDMIPKTWKDLADPKYKDKLVQGHIKAGGGTVYIFAFLTKMYGWEFLDALKNNNVQTQESCVAVDLLVQGERLVSLCDYSTGFNAKKQRQPIDNVLPADGVPAYIGPAGVLAKAPHPNAARLLMDWLISPAGQTIHVSGGVLSPLNSPEIKYPQTMLDDTKNLKLVVSDWKEVGNWGKTSVNRFSDIFGG
jgi:iron(III) transport system substrate-binding protein